MDEKERDTFNNVNWWDLNGPVAGLHKMNKVRVNFVRENFALPSSKPHLPLNGLTIMDVGCGAGILAEPLARLGAKVVGIDPLTQAIQSGEEHLKIMRQQNNETLDLLYINADINSAKEKFIESMDLVILSEVVEHVENWKGLLSEAAECVKPGGSLVVTTINRTYTAWLTAIIAAERILGIVPRGTHEYEKFVKPEEIRNAITKCMHSTLLKFYAFQVTWKLGKFWASHTIL
ncbi:Hexaprenyldihydroxybenzoate methyltransferase, mitochondrial [Cichlidogyrus casuarinus]|uniref:Hexaprenyldihydroxybenzoate methyltransferase, mitochondrial n=1 Tax=Cichlidogyrus casuarinus TaxID=1844966 RepID=A0ABD2QLG1_9PLAT